MCGTTGYVPVYGAEAPGAVQHYAVQSSATAHGGPATPAGAPAPADAAAEDRAPSFAMTSAAAAARASAVSSAATDVEQRSGLGFLPNPHTDPAVDVTFTATRIASGALLLGSSREEVGFDAAPSEAVAGAILAHGAAFLPQACLHNIFGEQVCSSCSAHAHWAVYLSNPVSAQPSADSADPCTSFMPASRLRRACMGICVPRFVYAASTRRQPAVVLASIPMNNFNAGLTA